MMAIEALRGEGLRVTAAPAGSSAAAAAESSEPAAARAPGSLWSKVSAQRVLGEGDQVWGRSAAVRLDAEGRPSVESVPGVLARLEASDAAVRAEGTLLLAMIVEGASGREALMLGEYLREVGALELLVELLDEDDPLTVQRALMVLGNLCSDSFDPNSAATKRALMGKGGVNHYAVRGVAGAASAKRGADADEEGDGASHRVLLNRLVLHVEDPDTSTRLYALAALQNIVTEQALALAAIEEGACRAIERVLDGIEPPVAVPEPDGSADANIYYFASGCLLNMNDAMASHQARDERQGGAGSPSRMRELSGRSSLRGWHKLRSIGALSISEGSAAAVEWRRTLQSACGETRTRNRLLPRSRPAGQETDTPVSPQVCPVSSIVSPRPKLSRMLWSTTTRNSIRLEATAAAPTACGGRLLRGARAVEPPGREPCARRRSGRRSCGGRGRRCDGG